jgi:hypothetical protein
MSNSFEGYADSPLDSTEVGDPTQFADEEPFDPDMAFTNDMPDQEPDAADSDVTVFPSLDSLASNPMVVPLRAAREHDIAAASGITGQYIDKERAALEPGGFTPWGIENSALDGDCTSFGAWFESTLPPGTGIRTYIEETLEPLTTRIGVELGGEGSELFAGFTEGFFDETTGVTLVDGRASSQFYDTVLSDDAERNHDVLEGNALLGSTKQKVDEWLDGRQLSVVFERMYAGVVCLPQDPYILAENANHWYERLAEGGLMFMQVPPGLEPYIDEWEQLIAADERNLDVQVGQYEQRKLVRIHKLPGAPKNLPLISARHLIEKRHAV